MLDRTQSLSDPSFAMPIVNRVADLQPDIQAWRRISMNIRSCCTTFTALRHSWRTGFGEFGCDDVVTGLGRTGVVGVIKVPQARQG